MGVGLGDFRVAHGVLSAQIVGVITASDRRRALESAWTRAVAEGAPLRDILRREEDAAWGLVAGGSVSSSNMGALATSFVISGGRASVTAYEVAQLWSGLVDVWDYVTGVMPESNEAQRYDAALRLVRVPRKSYVIDARGSRFA